MSGVDIVGEVLRDDDAITALVPPERIRQGALAEGAALPSLLIRSISETERLKLRRTGWVRVIERVEVMVRAGSYRDAKAIRALVRDTLAGRTGSVGGSANVAILNAGAGPDLMGPGSSYERAQDFRVSFDIQT